MTTGEEKDRSKAGQPVESGLFEQIKTEGAELPDEIAVEKFEVLLGNIEIAEVRGICVEKAIGVLATMVPFRDTDEAGRLTAFSYEQALDHSIATSKIKDAILKAKEVEESIDYVAFSKTGALAIRDILTGSDEIEDRAQELIDLGVFESIIMLDNYNDLAIISANTMKTY